MVLRFLRSFFVGVGLLFVVGGAFFLWQMAFQGTGACYDLPTLSFQLLPFLQAYQGACAYNAVPNYVAGDLSMVLIVVGFGLAVFRPGNDGEVEVG